MVNNLAQRSSASDLKSKKVNPFIFTWKNKYTKRIFQYFVLVLWSIFIIFPIYWVITSSLKTPMDVFAFPPKWTFTPTLHNYEVVFGLETSTEMEGITEATAGTGSTKLLRYFLNTVIISVGSTVFSVAVGCLAAYSLTRSRLRGRKTILTGVLLTQFLPPVVLLVPIYVLWCGFHIQNTHIGMILAYLTFSLPFSIWMLYSFIAEIPQELEEAAMVDGCNRFQALVRVVFPLIAPGIATTAVFNFLNTWNEFLFASVLAGETAKTLSVSILTFITDKAILWGQLYAAGTAIILPSLILTFIIQKYIGRGMTSGALKG